MPKDPIDSLLESMFRSSRSGKTSKKSETFSAAAVPELVLEPDQRSEKVKKAMADMEQITARNAANLQKSLDALAKETQADMAELEQRLAKDGLETGPAANQGSLEDLDAAFAKARREAGQQVLGQEKFLSALTVAFKRPFVAGSEKGKPLAAVLVGGKPGTGRRSALELLTASLGRQGVLKSPKLVFLKLGRYGEPGSEKLFLQDLYAALKSGASGLVLEDFRQCHPSVLPLVSSLFREGEAPLPGRYAEQKGMLVDIGTALVPGAVSSLSGAGKYLFLLTDQPEEKVADAFGMPFLAGLDDLCITAAFQPEDLEAIGKRCLEELCTAAQKRLGIRLTFEPQAVQALAGCFRPEEGVPSLQKETDRLYRALSEWKLQGDSPESAAVTAENGALAIRCQGAQLIGAAPAGDQARKAAVEAVKQELDSIVGLAEVKEYILSLEDHFQVQQLRRARGMKAETPVMHMIFTGNPGTGKTTMARMVARYLKAIGALEGGQLIEVTRSDLVGQYVGHTAPLTQRAIQSALGGVLFIDEAYSLYRGRDDSFGLEAIDTLVKGMEDHRDRLVVILAGYSYEMEAFLQANSGLRSRFPNVVEFPDYTAGELLDITKSIVGGKGYRLAPDCEQPLLAYFERMQQQGDPRTNGNGRMARNKVEEAVLNCSRRALQTPEDQQDLELLLPEDFELD